jgi:hypothetical protein
MAAAAVPEPATETRTTETSICTYDVDFIVYIGGGQYFKKNRGSLFFI